MFPEHHPGQTEEVYEHLRRYARETTVIKFRRRLNDVDAVNSIIRPTKPANKLVATAVDDYVINYFQSSDINIDTRSEFFDAIEQFQNRPKRFEMALWNEHELVSIAFGQPSRGGDNVTLRFVRALPHVGRITNVVAPLTVDAADHYARLLEKDAVIVKAPREEDVPQFESLGFRSVSSSTPHTSMRREVGE
jgi:hypothetical protein